MKLLWILLGLTLLSIAPPAAASEKALVGGRCDGCELMFEGMPASLTWETAIPGPGEPGEPMEISGTIYRKDGKTPAAGVILYVYHTDAKGLYEPAAGQTSAHRHGRLRGWMKTDERGRYKFRTIRPASYPGTTIPAHVHPTVKEPDKNEYYLDELRFDDDPLLTSQERSREEKRGGSGLVRLQKRDGVWVATHDIVLGMNVPDYP